LLCLGRIGGVGAELSGGAKGRPEKGLLRCGRPNLAWLRAPLAGLSPEKKAAHLPGGADVLLRAGRLSDAANRTPSVARPNPWLGVDAARQAVARPAG